MLYDEIYDDLKTNKGLSDLSSLASPRPHYKRYTEWLSKQNKGILEQRRAEAELFFRRVGITFNVYGEAEGTERLIPSDVVPRIISHSEWLFLEKGLKQRVQALNCFMSDIYGAQHILKAGVVPAEPVLTNAQFKASMIGYKPKQNIWSQVTGVDIVRNNDGNYYVLEDNARVPSGVSYMLQNRKMMQRLFPDLFKQYNVCPIEHYPALLCQTLRETAPCDDPVIAVLTPGPYNSAYFEHAYLAQQMGVELVEGQDLFVHKNRVYMRTTFGPKPVDILYRRIDDDYLDPLCFNPTSALGVPGMVSVIRQGNLALANAIGTGVADDKSIYPYVGDMIRYYLNEEPILNNVQTYLCRRPSELQFVLENLDKLVVKEVHGAGGYGMLIGPTSTKAEQEDFRLRLLANPSNYIAQPTLSLSACGIWLNEELQPRHIDLRPFVLSGAETRIVPGGLTRVAMTKGSLVVNSSQGGGTKDTWVLQSDEEVHYAE